MYQAIWAMVISKIPDIALHLRTVICDFEMALIAATRAAFNDGVQIRGCWFHFTRVSIYIYILKLNTLPNPTMSIHSSIINPLNELQTFQFVIIGHHKAMAA